MIGSSTIVVDSTPAVNNNGNVGTLTGVSTATCGAGQKLLGGGVNITQGTSNKVAVASSYASGATTWSAEGMVVVRVQRDDHRLRDLRVVTNNTAP